MDKGKDPMLPSQCPDPVSSSMMREIMSDIPIKYVGPVVILTFTEDDNISPVYFFISNNNIRYL